MGNDYSDHFSSEDIDEKAVQTCKYWSLHSVSNQFASVFIGPKKSTTSTHDSQVLLEKFAKNLMVFRHPSILKYITSWSQNSKFYLAVEEVKPLSCVLNTQNTLQKCTGLYSILKAVCFLHETGGVSHNNITLNAIYITEENEWKLGGMELCCKFNDLTIDYLNKIEKFRQVSIEFPKEEYLKPDHKYSLDSFDFSKLACEILENEEDVSCLASFRELCKAHLQSKDSSARPKLTTLLDHSFFKNDFVTIYSSLLELPLMDITEKSLFFSSLSNKLKQFDEVLVAKQLGSLLLSRLIFLDETAQKHLLPFILQPRQDSFKDALFSKDTYKKHIIPRLLKIFCVRDIQIRLSLLEHFSHYVFCFSRDELQHHILPELLVGIKDVDNQLVSATLKALSDVVQILGAEVVIGGKRAKLFNDGRPNALVSTSSSETKILINENIHLSNENRESSIPEPENVFCLLPERSRPDGEENLTSENQSFVPNEDLNSWDDWNANNQPSEDDLPKPDEDMLVSIEENNIQGVQVENKKCELEVKNTVKVKKVTKRLPDILHLDIKNQVEEDVLNDMDLFEGMEPVINVTQKALFRDADEKLENSVKLNLSANFSDDAEIGWEDDWDKDS